MKEVVITQELLNEFKNIPWLENCGKTTSIQLICSIENVNGWEMAEVFYGEEEWDEVISNGREKLAKFIMDKLGYSVRDFNSVVVAIRESAQYKTAVSELNNIINNHHVTAEFGDTLSWLLLNAGIERVFREYKGCPNFFSEMLTVIKHGHCPCGWRGNWPKGTLFIY